ncbi:MAG: ThuA domain-containing protein [Opitutales bacterium]
MDSYFKQICWFLLIALWIIPAEGFSEKVGRFPLNDEWLELIESRAPEKADAEAAQPRKVLVFTKITGFVHWATPHTAEVVRILGEKTGAYEALISDDISLFEKEKIDQFDAIVLVNNCSHRKYRHLFRDAIEDVDKAIQLEDNLIEYVAGGKGAVAIHGSIAMINTDGFNEVLGGAFDFHPKQQMMTCVVLDHDHPISSAFGGENMVHYDEPYCFKDTYFDFNFHPLLEMDLNELKPSDLKKMIKRSPGQQQVRRYISWIKTHGEGRVFYCSPSHNAQSFENPALMKFVLNGIQYAIGDLDAPDQPVGKAEQTHESFTAK